jgi:hypothetical protein
MVFFLPFFICIIFTIVLDVPCQQIVKPVLGAFGDQDSRVRYYACEALYNIAKVRMEISDCPIYISCHFVILFGV